MKKLWLVIALVGFSLPLVYLNPAAAHYAWITVDKDHPAIGDEVIVNICWGHKFPIDGQLRQSAYPFTNLAMIDPQGQQHRLALIPAADQGNQPITVKMEKEGVYTFVLTQKNFSSKTTKGYQSQPKNELENVLHTRWNETVSKAVVTVGAPGKKFQSLVTTDRFQVIPLENPLQPAKGDYLPVKITLDGKPWSGMVYATYQGFSDAPDTFAYAAATDNEGVVKIKIVEKGLWLIKAEHSYPYPDQNKADDYSLKATLTFAN